MIKIEIRPGGADIDAIHKSISNEINSLEELVSPTGNEVFILEDPNDTFQKKKVILSSFSGTDLNAIHKTIAAEISGLTQKINPSSTDLVLIEDSEDGFSKKSAFFPAGGSGNDPDAIHKTVAAEIFALTSKLPPNDNDILIIEDSQDSYNKKKILISSIGTDDINAFHKTISGEFDALVEKISILPEDLFVIEDSEDIYSKKKIKLQAITIDNIGDGTTYKKFLSTERTKLTGIEDNADVTDVDNVTTAEQSINVNAHSDITSAGADIEDAVSKRHTQGTDTTLGIQAQNSDWGTYRITNAGEPVDPGDYATKNYVDTQELSHDPNAVHLNAGSEITTLTEKISPVVDDILIIEDSEDSFAKKKVSFPVYSDHDPNAIHLNADSEITTLDEKTTPVATDILIIEDSEDSFSKKKILFPITNEVETTTQLDITSLKIVCYKPDTTTYILGSVPTYFTFPYLSFDTNQTRRAYLRFIFLPDVEYKRILGGVRITFPTYFDRSKIVKIYSRFSIASHTPEQPIALEMRTFLSPVNQSAQGISGGNHFFGTNTIENNFLIGEFPSNSLWQNEHNFELILEFDSLVHTSGIYLDISLYNLFVEFNLE